VTLRALGSLIPSFECLGGGLAADGGRQERRHWQLSAGLGHRTTGA
jgi:hypothetical protein